MADILQNMSLWLGVPNMSKDQLKNFDPAYTGYVHVFVVRVPEVLTKHDTVFGTSYGKNFKAIFERTSTSFSGIPELTINYVDQVHGFPDRKMPHAGAIEANFDQMTIRCLEFKKLPVFNMIQEWMYLVGGDESSKIKDYKGMASSMAGGYSLENHTAGFIVCNSNPELTEIQGRAHYITAASPISLPRELYHLNPGEINIVEGHDIAMKGVLKWGPEINTKALSLLTERKTIINYYAGASVRAGTVIDNPFHPGGSLNGETINAQTTII